MSEKEIFAFELADLVTMMHRIYVSGYVSGVIGEPSTDENVIPMDKGGPDSTHWFKQKADEIRAMPKREDGTSDPCLD